MEEKGREERQEGGREGRRKGRKEEGKEEGEKGGNDSREEKRFGNTDTHSNVLNMQSTTCMSTLSNSYPTSKERGQTYCPLPMHYAQNDNYAYKLGWGVQTRPLRFVLLPRAHCQSSNTQSTVGLVRFLLVHSALLFLRMIQYRHSYRQRHNSDRSTLLL